MIFEIYSHKFPRMYASQGVAATTVRITEVHYPFTVTRGDLGVDPRDISHTLGCISDSWNLGPPQAIMAGQDPGGQPPDQRPPAYTGPFLFVNKNATNLRSRQREEVFAVRSHAMQIARRSRKPPAQSKSQERESQATPEIQKPETPATQSSIGSPPTESIPSIQDILEQQQRQFQRGQSSQSRRQSATHRFSGAPSPSSALPGAYPLPVSNLLPAEHAASLSQLVLAPSPTSISPGGLSDSGGAASAPDTFFNSVLQFWRLAFMSNFWPAHIYLNPTHRSVQFTDSWVRTMVINSPAMLHGLFSGALSYITNYLPPTDSTPMLWARAIHHHGKCLEETRVQLARPGISTEEALSLINGMTTFSFHCQDLESCQVHRAASMRLLQTLEEGLDSLHPVLKYLLILCDSLIASHVPKRPSIDVESWAPMSWEEEESLRPYDDIFDFDAESHEHTDIAVFLLGTGGQMSDFGEHLLELINWHREAIVASDLASTLINASQTVSPGIAVTSTGGGRDLADPIYTWLSLRQYALSCLCSMMTADLAEVDGTNSSLASQMRRVFHTCVLLATSYLCQFVLRRDMDAPCMAYIPYHHLRTQLELLMALMSQHRRTSPRPAGLGGGGRGPMSPIPTDGLLFLFFAGAVIEENDGPSRVQASHHAVRAGLSPSPVVGNPGDLIHERWFSVHFAMVSQKLGLDVWENAQRVLKRYVYTERVLDRFLQALVARRLEFLAALVAGVPTNTPTGGTGFFAGSRRPSPVGHGTSSSSRPPGHSLRSSLQIATQQGPHFRQPAMPLQMLPGSPSIAGQERFPESLALFGQTPVSLSASAPSVATDWWQDMGYGLGGEDDFSMDLDMQLSMGAGLENLPDLPPMQGEDDSDPEQSHGEQGSRRG